jgi:hypothetical protein
MALGRFGRAAKFVAAGGLLAACAVAGGCQNLNPVKPMPPTDAAVKLDTNRPADNRNPDPDPPKLDAGTKADGPATNGDGPPVTDAAPPADRAPMADRPPVDTAPPVDGPQPAEWWKPTAGMTWDWQLKTPIDPTFNVQVYDIDLFENSAEVIADLHARGKKVICYVNLGAWESWRPDADKFPKSLLGAAYHNFPDENWLDIRQIALLSPLVRARLLLARSKGCDAVEPDNMDGWDTMAHEPTGFPLTRLDQIIYNRFVAAEAHALGLAVGLKNDVQQVPDLVGNFDFHVSEQCYEHAECQLLKPFIDQNKPVFLAEYTWTPAQFCAMSKAAKISAIRKKPELDAWRETCPP